MARSRDLSDLSGVTPVTILRAELVRQWKRGSDFAAAWTAARSLAASVADDPGWVFAIDETREAWSYAWRGEHTPVTRARLADEAAGRAREDGRRSAA